MNRHSNRTQKAAWAALATAAVLCLALAPAASALDIADVRAGSGGLDFVPQVEHGGFVLTVAGPEGFHHRAEFGAGESPSFSIFEQGGGVLPDGVYNYELTVVPSATQRRDAFEANQVEKKSGGVQARVQSGAFSIVAGSVVAGGETEPGQGPAGSGPVLAPKTTILTTADGTIINSLCVGTDCTGFESFGFDTLRLKENNTRIKFDDTSTTGSFPFTDWQLTANDSANGGANKFSIDDITNSRTPFTIEANSPSNTLYVDSNKRIGIGTSTPAVQLHVKDGDSPALRLEQDTSSGFAAQTWDVAGNETNFFVRSASTGSQLPFRIRPGAPTSSIDIAADGDVGIGTTSPDAPLDVERSNGTAQVRVTDTTATDGPQEMLVLQSSTAANARPRFTFINGSGTWFFEVNGTNFDINRSGSGSPEELQLQDDGDLVIAGNLTELSSRAAKEDFVALDPVVVLNRLAELPVLQWKYKANETGSLHVGPMAEDFYEAFGLGEDAKHISPSDKAGVALLAIQGLTRMIQEKDGQIQALEERLAALEEAGKSE